MIVVEFFGGPGSGKTTTAASTWGLLKQNGVPCEFVREYAQTVIYQGRTRILQSQFVISANQYRQYVEHLVAGTELLFADSSALLCGVYGAGEPHISGLQHYIQGLYNSEKATKISFIRIFVRRRKAYQTQGRIHSELESRELDDEIRNMCRPFDAEVDGTVEGLYELLRLLPGLLLQKGYVVDATIQTTTPRGLPGGSGDGSQDGPVHD